MTPAGRLSTSTCWPRLPDNPGTIIRAAKSFPPPGSDVTMRIGFVGKLCAAAEPVTNAPARANIAIRRRALKLRLPHRRDRDDGGKRSMSLVTPVARHSLHSSWQPDDLDPVRTVTHRIFG